MAEIIRTTGSKYRDDYSSDDDRGSSYGRSRGYPKETRYRVTPSRGERVEDNVRIVRSDRLDVGPRGAERVTDTDRVRTVVARPRSYVEPDRERERERNREVSRTIDYDRDGRDRELVARGWERESDRTDRTWERERDADLRIERRTKISPYEVESYRRETEYYTRPDAVIVRRQSPERERAIDDRDTLPRDPRGYAVLRRDEPRELVRGQEEALYYRRDVRDVRPRDEEIALYDRRGSDDYDSDGSASVVRSRRGERGRSHSPHHKLHLAEGALAGAGAAAILAHHRSKSGAPPRTATTVASGAALGAIGAQLITRARSRHQSRSRNRSRSRSSSPSSHSKLKTGLGVAALAIAAAAAGKYLADRNSAKKEEQGRGRSRTRSASRSRRYSTDDEGARIKNRSRSRVATIAKAGAGAAAVAGIVEAIRSRSQQRKGGRSRSRLRTGGAIAATGLAGAAVASLYEARKKNQEKKDEQIRGRNPESRSRSRPRSLYSDSVDDPERGLVEYGAYPVHHETQTYTQTYDPALAAPPAPGYDPRDRSRSRSRSRIGNLAAGALAGGATVYGVEQLYQQRKERKAAEREERRRYEEDMSAENYYANDSYDDGYSPSPPRASGGALYPDPHPPIHTQQTTTTTTTHTNEPLPHPPLQPTGFFGDQPPPHDPYGYPPTAAHGGENVSTTTPLPPHFHRSLHDEEDRLATSPLTYTPSSSPSPPPHPSDAPHNRSVTFAPLSPSSSRHLDQTKTRLRRNSDPSADRPNSRTVHRRRHRNASRSPSPDEEVEELPDRFDRDGRPLDGSRGLEHQVTDRIVRDFGEVLEGRASWKDLLRGVLEEATGSDDGGGVRSRRRR